MDPSTRRRDIVPVPPRPSEFPHYCRVCGNRFETTSTASSHTQYRDHLFQAHRAEYRTKEYTCTRNCQGVAQPEERRVGRQLYGGGVTTPTVVPLKAYEALFPEEVTP
jgi:hypothetical protein